MDENIQEPTPTNSEPMPAPGPTPEQPVVAQEAQVVPAPAVVADPKKSNKTSAFDRLPADIRLEFQKVLLSSSAHNAKAWFTEKYGEKYPEVAKLGKLTYGHYKRNNKERLEKEFSTTEGIVKLGQELQKISSDTSLTITDRRSQNARMLALGNELMQDCIDQRKKTQFMDPMQDRTIQDWMKMLLQINADNAKADIELTKQANTDNFEELGTFFKVIMSGVKNAYQLVHKENNQWDAVYHKLLELIAPMLQRYKILKTTILQ